MGTLADMQPECEDSPEVQEYLAWLDQLATDDGDQPWT